jgi:hypothetical protein
VGGKFNKETIEKMVEEAYQPNYDSILNKWNNMTLKTY